MIKEKNMEDFIRPACYKESTGQIHLFPIRSNFYKITE